MIDFLDITYLSLGNQKQQKVHRLLVDNRVMEMLSIYAPILVGTIPLNIDIETSDLDIICHVRDKKEFIENLIGCFQDKVGFRVTEVPSFNAVKANFSIDGFELEIFGQDLETVRQNAYRHMIIEYRILLEKGPAFRQQIIKLKRQGIKTEPAFARLLGLKGDPYRALLKLEPRTC